MKKLIATYMIANMAGVGQSVPVWVENQVKDNPKLLGKGTEVKVTYSGKDNWYVAQVWEEVK